MSFFEHGSYPMLSEGRFMTCAGSWFRREGILGIPSDIVSLACFLSSLVGVASGEWVSECRLVADALCVVDVGMQGSGQHARS